MGIRGLWILTFIFAVSGQVALAAEARPQVRIGDQVASVCRAINGNPVGPLCLCRNNVDLRTVRERRVVSLVEPFKEGCNGKELNSDQLDMACQIRNQGARLHAQATPGMQSLLRALDRQGMLNFKLEGIFSATSPLAAVTGAREQIGQALQRFTRPQALARETAQEGLSNIMGAARSHFSAIARESLENIVPASLAGGAAMARQAAEQVGVGEEDLRAVAQRRGEVRNLRTHLRDLGESARNLPQQARALMSEAPRMMWNGAVVGGKALLRGGAWGAASLGVREGAKAYFGINLDWADPIWMVEQLVVAAAVVRDAHASTPSRHYQRFPLDLLLNDVPPQMACDMMKENAELRAKVVAAAFALEHLTHVANEAPPETRLTEATFCFTCRMTSRLVTHY